MQGFVIICVDDERVVLEGLRVQLEREFGKDHLIEFALSGEEALEMIKELISTNQRIAVVITDQLMPGMKGSDLLHKLKSMKLGALNIMLTGQAGADEVGDAVNNGDLYRYIAKPWESNDLLITVREALASYSKDRKLEEKNALLEQANRNLESRIAERTEELAEQKAKVDALLRNILPEKVAMELVEKGSTTPAHFDEVTILFSDFVNFTNIVASIPVKILVEELNVLFSRFDDIMDEEGVEKIQTVGDAYLAASGLPTHSADHGLRCVRAAMRMIEFIDQRNEESSIKWEIRIGLHSGPIAAGVVGKRKFAYNLFGDTINIAARVESEGEPGKINVSAYTYHLIRHEYDCEYRGKISAKGKGDLDMYFVNQTMSDQL